MKQLKNFMKTGLTAMMIALLPTAVHSQQTTPTDGERQTPSERRLLTLDECQRMATENYPLLEQYGIIHQSTEFTVQNINRGYLPQLSFSAQATYQSDVMTMPSALTGMMAAQGTPMLGLDKDQYRIALDLNQTIYDGGNLYAQKKAAKAQGEVKTAEVDVQMHEVKDRVNNLFFGILLIDDKIQLNADLQKLLESSHEKVDNLCRNGVALESDADMVKVELLKSRQQAAELQAMRNTFAQMLAIFTGKKAEDIRELKRPTADKPTEMTNHRPELSLFNAQLKHNDAQKRLLTASVLPRLSLFAQGYYGYPGLNMFDDMFSHDLSWNGMVGVRLQWNVSSLYTNRNERRKLSLARSAVETARETFLFNNSMLTAQERNNIARYEQQIADDVEIVRLRSSIRKAAEAKLEHGVIDVTNLLQYITQENQALIDRSTHEIEMLKHIHELKHALNHQ